MTDAAYGLSKRKSEATLMTSLAAKESKEKGCLPSGKVVSRTLFLFFKDSIRAYLCANGN